MGESQKVVHSNTARSAAISKTREELITRKYDETIEHGPSIGSPIVGEPWADDFEVRIEYDSAQAGGFRRRLGFHVRATRRTLLILVGLAMFVGLVLSHNSGPVKHLLDILKGLK